MIITWFYAMNSYTCIGNILCWISNILWDSCWHEMVRKRCKKLKKLQMNPLYQPVYLAWQDSIKQWKICITMIKYSKTLNKAKTPNVIFFLKKKVLLYYNRSRYPAVLTLTERNDGSVLCVQQNPLLIMTLVSELSEWRRLQNLAHCSLNAYIYIILLTAAFLSDYCPLYVKRIGFNECLLLQISVQRWRETIICVLDIEVTILEPWKSFPCQTQHRQGQVASEGTMIKNT